MNEMIFKNNYVNNVFNNFVNKNQYQKEYIDACKEILESLQLYIDKHPEIEKYNILERFLEPERSISFKVSWVDDNNIVRVNRGYRVQYNSALGPYKGGIRFHPSVNSSIINFLALEQCLKNSLTGLPLGGGKGGSDFDPKGKSDGEIMRFCQSFMNELYRHIGPHTDVPAGDLGVGAKEIGYLFGQYKKIRNEHVGVLTGKGISFGGSNLRPEATGYGLCYFTRIVLDKILNTTFDNKEVIISGFGNVAFFAFEKAIELNAKVVALSNTKGYIYDKNGLKYDIIRKIKERNGSLKDYLIYVPSAEFNENYKDIFTKKCDIVLPCATQNEIDLKTAKMLVKNGVKVVCEGANMPCSLDAIHCFIDNNVVFAPGKASNAGGVAVSGLEMSQNALGLGWTRNEVDQKLEGIMVNIFNNIYSLNKEYNIRDNDLITCANIAGFEKICVAMIAQGII